jgi:hypothetical protein
LLIFPKHILAVKFPNYWGGLLGGSGTYTRYDEGVVNITGMWGYFDYRYPSEAWLDTFETVQNAGGISASDTSIEIIDPLGADSFGRTKFRDNQMIRVDDELMEVTSVNNSTNPKTITVIRGIKGSTAISHDNGAAITSWRVIEDIVEATLQVAKIWRESDVTAGGRLGVSDVSAGVEVGIPADALNVIKSYQRSLL